MKNSPITLLSAPQKGRRALFSIRKAGLVSGTAKTLTLLLVALSTLLASCQEDEEDAPAPVIGTIMANAGADQTTQVGQTVTLDGSGSKDSRNDSISYNWSVVLKPAGSTPDLTNPKKVKPTFVPDAAGDYKLELTVSSKNGQKKDTVQVTATPVSDPNSATILSTDIISDLVLKDKFSEPGKADYIVTGFLRVSAPVRVEPGVVVEFEADKGLRIAYGGSLNAIGNATKKIVFTGRNKTPGFWRGIMVESTSDLNAFDYVEVAYGGSSDLDPLLMNVKTNVGIVGGYMSNASFRVTNSTFKHANGYGMSAGNLTQFANNTFTDNSTMPLNVAASVAHMLDAASTFVVQNDSKGVAISGSIPEYHTSNWPALKNGVKYIAIDDITVEGDLTVAPGVTVEFMRGKGMEVRGMGTLKAIGTADKKITFTGWSKLKGAWKGIVINSAKVTSELTHTEVAYGGETSYRVGNRDLKANVLLWANPNQPGTRGVLKLTHSSITNSGGYGLVVAPGGGYLSDFASNVFSHNTGAALFIDPNQIYRLDNHSRFNLNNGYNGLETEGVVSEGGEVAWPTPIGGLYVHVLSDLYIRTGVKMISQPQKPIVVQFNENRVLRVQNNGYLVAKGLKDSDVSFTGFHGQNKLAYWQGIIFESRSPLNELNEVNVSYGGTNIPGEIGPTANITVRGAVKLIDCEIYNSLGWGVFAAPSSTINADAKTANWFGNNAKGSIYKVD
ncbi:PKD domain-containing protein [Rufibacter latericius]|nr:PKD domain-containing protein [Rufibacter latericius]